MTRFTILFASCAFHLAVLAQPVLTHATNSPVPGTTYTLHHSPYLPPGDAGADRTWDLAALASDSSLLMQVVTPASTPNGDQFPTANIAEVNDVVTQYYNVQTDGIHFAGSDDGESVIVHSAMGTFLPFPCTFGTSWSAPQNGTFTYEGTEVVRTGTFSGVADGHGILVMPGGTISNVLRVHWTHTLQDVMDGFIIDHVYDSYVFFAPGQSHPIAELVTATIDFGFGPTTEQFSRWTSDLSTGMDADVAHHVTVFPNPASEEVSVVWPAQLGARAAVFAMDMNGRRALLGRYSAVTGTTMRIDIRSLRPGMYHLVFVGETEQQLTVPLIVR